MRIRVQCCPRCWVEDWRVGLDIGSWYIWIQLMVCSQWKQETEEKLESRMEEHLPFPKGLSGDANIESPAWRKNIQSKQ